MLVGQHAIEPFLHELLAGAAMVAGLVSRAAAIRLSLHPSPAFPTSAFSRMRALVSRCAGCLPVRIISSSRSRSFWLNFTTYFLTAISLMVANQLRPFVTESSSQRSCSAS
jgi:hypothetical protein